MTNGYETISPIQEIKIVVVYICLKAITVLIKRYD